MPSNYFGGAPNAFAGGQEFGAAQRQRRLQENALNALIQRFGPEAASPAALAALQGADQSAQMFPHQLGAAERSTAAHQANVEQHGAVAGDPAAAGVDDAMNQRLRGAMLNAATYLQRTQQRGGDPAEAFQRVVPILSAIGLPTEQIAAVQQQIITDPSSLDELVAMLRGDAPGAGRSLSGGQPMYDEQGNLRWVIPTETGHRVIEGFTPATAAQGEQRLAQGEQRLGLGYRRLSWDQAKALLPSAQPGVQYSMGPEGQVVADFTPGSPQQFEREETLSKQDAADRVNVRVATGMREAATTVVSHGNRALGIMNDPGWIQRHGVLNAVARRAAANVPGTQMFELDRDIQSVKDNIGINELLRIKESGSGLGHVPQRQLETLQSVLGRLEISRNPETLRADLANALRIFENIVQMQETEVREAQRRIQRREEGRREQESLDDLLSRYAPR